MSESIALLIESIKDKLEKLESDREFWERESFRNKEAACQWYAELEKYKKMYSDILKRYQELTGER